MGQSGTTLQLSLLNRESLMTTGLAVGRGGVLKGERTLVILDKESSCLLVFRLGEGVLLIT